MPAQLGESKGHHGRAQDRESGALSLRLVSMKEAGAMIGVSYWTVRGWVETGKLPHYRLPVASRRSRRGPGSARTIRVKLADLVTFAEAHRIAP